MHLLTYLHTAWRKPRPAKWILLGWASRGVPEKSTVSRWSPCGSWREQSIHGVSDPERDHRHFVLCSCGNRLLHFMGKDSLVQHSTFCDTKKTIKSYQQAYFNCPSQTMVLSVFYHVSKKTAPFYFCNNFVRLSSILTIFFSKFSIASLFHILYKVERGELA